MFSVFKTYAVRHYQEYQDVLIDNVVVQKGLDDCQRRYEALKSILDRYKRPITVLDLGAGLGYFSFRIAHDYDATCIMIEDNNGPKPLARQLLDLCRANAQLKNIILLDKKISLQELEKLADCEHFDVVLAFDYIDLNAHDWMQTANALMRMGDNIFIQVPGSESATENKASKKVIEYCAARSGKLILQTPCVYDAKMQKQLFWFEYKKTGLRSKCFTLESDDAYVDAFHIDSSYTSKTFYKTGSPEVEWKKGINLMTFLMLNGAYPTRDMVKDAVAAHAYDQLTDFAPWNVIVQGEYVDLIDQKDKGWKVNVHKSLKFINGLLDQTTEDDIIGFLKHYRKWRVRKRK